MAAISVCATAPGSTAVQSMAPHLNALYALAYLLSRGDDTACQAVAGALGGVRRDRDSSASIGGPSGSAGLWRALADQLHARSAADSSAVRVQGDAALGPLGGLRCEAIALHAAGFTASHAAGLLGLPHPVVRALRRAR